MALRTQLEAGETDTKTARRRLSELAQVLLARHPRDAELKHVARSLAARRFVPAPPATLPRGTASAVRRALLRRGPADLAALASALVVIPDPASAPEAATAALELFLRVPGEEARAQALMTALQACGHDVSLARCELALRTADATKPELFLPALAEVSPDQRAEAERRAAVRALGALLANARAPHGCAWLVACRDGTSIANHALAFARRPALRTELGIIADWVEAADPALDAAHAADRQGGDGSRGAALLERALDEDDYARVLAARAQVLGSGAFAAAVPAIAADVPLPRSGLADRLEKLALADSSEGLAEPLDAGALELLGDAQAAAQRWLQLAIAGDTVALVHAARLVSTLRAAEKRRLIGILPGDDVLDETRLSDPDARVRAELLHALEPDPWLPIRLAHAHPAGPSAPPDAPEVAESDPHHPDNRLAAASDLLAAGKLEPASNILSALVRKVDEHAPARLFTVVAQALEADEPVADLVHAAQRALADPRRCPALLEALRKAPSAAFALHEDLIAFALDPSRSDIERLHALEVWLAIWRATETPPDPDAIRTLREDEPALLIAAAVRLGGQADPLSVLGRFLREHAPRTSDPEAFSARLLALSLGR